MMILGGPIFLIYTMLCYAMLPICCCCMLVPKNEKKPFVGLEAVVLVKRSKQPSPGLWSRRSQTTSPTWTSSSSSLPFFRRRRLPRLFFDYSSSSSSSDAVVVVVLLLLKSSLASRLIISATWKLECHAFAPTKPNLQNSS